MAVVVGAVAGYATSTAVSTYIGGQVLFAGITTGMVVGTIAGAIVSNVVTGALADEPEQADFGAGGTSGGLLINKQANDAPIPVIYGQRKIGGTRVLMEVTGTDNEYLNIVLTCCEGEIDSFENIYLNDVLSTDSKFTGFLDTYTHTGSTTQSADSNLVSDVTGWTTNHQLKGTSYLYVKLKFDQDVYASGLPLLVCQPLLSILKVLKFTIHAHQQLLGVITQFYVFEII